MRVSQRQLSGLTRRKSDDALMAQMATLREMLAREPVERVVYQTRIVEKPVEKIVERIVEVPGPTITKIVEKTDKKIVEVEKPRPLYSFAVNGRNAKGNITKMVATSAQSAVRYEFPVRRDESGKLLNVTMKMVKPEKDPTIYGSG